MAKHNPELFSTSISFVPVRPETQDAEVIMNLTNQTSLVLETELNNAPSVFPVNGKTIHKLKLFAPSGKVNAISNFASISELRDFIELNQPPRCLCLRGKIFLKSHPTTEPTTPF
jgi:hypothetical protein